MLVALEPLAQARLSQLEHREEVQQLQVERRVVVRPLLVERRVEVRRQVKVVAEVRRQMMKRVLHRFQPVKGKICLLSVCKAACRYTLMKP